MSEVVSKSVLIPKPGIFRWEIGIALLIKLLFLLGLWFLLFHWPNKPVVKPDIAAVFENRDVQVQQSSDSFSQPVKENRDVR